MSITVDVDVLITGVTGFVGRFVLLNLLETQPDSTRIAVNIRPTGSSSAEERFRKEIIGTSMFASWRDRLQKVLVIDSPIESLSLYGSVGRIIHCAGSFSGSYDALERDNVHNARLMMEVGRDVQCKSFTLLSTCFVHPRTVRVGPVERVTAAYEEFYNDYTYTKWRAEELAFDFGGVNILRLAVVGAPLRPDLQVHPHVIPALMQNMTHVTSVTVKPKSRISVVPVDIAAAEIVRLTMLSEKREGVNIAQICPPPSAVNFHLSLPLLAEVLQTEYGMKVIHGEQNTVNLLPWYKRPWFRKMATAYSQMRSALTQFTSEQVQFESSCAVLFDRRSDERGLVRDLCKYVERMYYEYKLRNHYQLPPSDLFIHKLTLNNPVVACITLENGYKAADWPNYKRKLWTAMCAHRKFTGVFDRDEIHTAELEFDAFFGKPVNSCVDIAGILEECVQSEPMKFAWKFKPVFNGEDITHILFIFDHGLTDGAGMIHIIQSVNKHVLGCGELSIQIPKREPAMSWWREIVTGISFLCMLIYTIILSDTSSIPSTPHVATGTRVVEKRADMTFTGDVLWRLTHMLKRVTGQDKHVIGVVAAGGIGSGILQNNCISIPLPVDASMTEAEFARRVGWLRSRAVLGISIVLQWLVELFHLEGFLRWVLKRVKILVSTMMMPTLPGAALYVCPNIPQMVSLGVTAVTKDGVTNLTARSHSVLFSATDTIAALT